MVFCADYCVVVATKFSQFGLLTCLVLGLLSIEASSAAHYCAVSK